MRRESEMGWLALHGARLEGDERRVFGHARAICDAVARYGPWLEREALKLVRGDKARAKRMARRAFERFWEWDVTRFTAGDESYLRRALLATLGARVPRARRARKHLMVPAPTDANGARSRKYFASVRGMEIE